MTDTMRILSRDAFAEVLAEARAHTRRLGGDLPALRLVAAQLDFLAEATANGRTPSSEDHARISLAQLSAREFAEADPDYADSLEELDYTFRRYAHLPPGPPARRRGILQIWSGRAAFTKVIFDLSEPRLLTPNGEPLVEPTAAPHVFLVWDGVSAHVQARGKHRLTINGAAAHYGEMNHLGWMTAGETTFRFLVEDHTPPPAPAEPTAAARTALAELTHHRDAGNLYAVIDAARSQRALQLVEQSVDPYASLYDGEAGRALDSVAPYLVHIRRRDSRLLEHLVHEGWGDAWGIFLTSPADPPALRRHLRQFLKVEADNAAHPLFFRYYDPRVFTDFAEVVTPEQRRELLADVDAFLYEDRDARLRRFAAV